MKLKFANLDFTPKEINEANHSLRAVFSTGDIDRHGEVVDQKSWILDDYLKNPVVLFGHDHHQPPVGKILGLGYNEDGNLEGELQFAAKEYPFANILWNLYKGGFMRAFSVGFSAGRIDIVDDQVILKDNTLYEISTVSVPANALALAKSKGLDTSALEEAMTQVKEVVDEGEVCEEHNIKECPCKKKPPVKKEEEEAIAESPAEEAVVEAAPEEVAAPTVITEEEVTEVAEVAPEGGEAVEEAAKALTDIVQKEGRVLSKTNRTAVEEAISALQKVLDADKPQEEENKSTSDNKTRISIKVETPNVRVSVPNKGPNKAKLINKAIRALLAEKRKN